ncbi:lysine-specific demethylase 2B-like [Actinia tenebrosa]|uniref:[histone H3]-dimethyl-L-lysine(36) demethylase n=1 Tax=Actinia tenebrosa TaxID=6105 RepID=A0A6P8HUY6_ACTTE|nr:lysine-specific demethylase 2B-like [Actinia tenebrosa]
METDLEASRNLRRQQRRNYHDNHQDDEIEGKRTFSVDDKLVNPKFEGSDFVQLMNGSDFTLKYIQENGFKTPLHIKNPEGLGMRMPSDAFTVTDVKNYVGARRMVDVIDVNTQQALELTLQNWVKYFTNPDRKLIYNVISLEFSHTKLQDIVESPDVVRQIDWVNTAWPKQLIEEQTDSTNSLADMKYPKVRKYCLMSVGGCYTDFHIDFGGTSVWYHIIKGQKIFWLIPPTETNLQLYEKWVLSGKQQDVFFGDQVERCSRVFLNSGDTFLIPTGWIHAVYTPIDTLVFGGNFLHSYSIKEQIRISQIEDVTKVPQKFRYPFYGEIMWYVAEKYTRLLRKDKEETKKDMNVKGKKNKNKATRRNIVTEDQGNLPEKKTVTTNGEETGRRRSTRVAKSEISREAYTKDSEDSPKPRKKIKLEKADENTETKKAEPEKNGCHSDGEGAGDTQDKPWAPVYLTKCETSGLYCLIERLRSWPHAQKCIPPTITNPEELLSELEDLLALHEDDDQSLATSGTQHLFKIDPPPKKQKSPRPKTGQVMSKFGTKVGPGVRRRRTRCGQCDNCQRDDCGECRTCKDMKKFGGPGRMKQSCLNRVCTRPNLPTCVRCLVCNGLNEEDKALMECRLCAEIVHPDCVDAEEDSYRIVPDINNCWECPKCCISSENGNEEERSHLAPRKRKGQPLTSKGSAKKARNGYSKKSSKRSDSGSESEVSENESNEEGENIEVESQPDKVTSRAKKTYPEPALPPPPPVEIKPKYVIRPGPLQAAPEALPLEDGGEHVLKSSDWLQIFSYLSQQELCVCMRVCRTWNRWCLNQNLWSVIDLSHKKITKAGLEGIVRRQPTTVNLSWTNITCKQLQWLLNRLPRLKELYLSGTTEATVSSLELVNCPGIRVLSLSWSTGVTDSVLLDLIRPPPPVDGRIGTGDGKSRLHCLSALYLTGNDVTGKTLQLLMQQCPSLRKIDLSYCPAISDNDIQSLTDFSTCGHAVKEILLTGCGKLTDGCLKYINRCPSLERLDLRACTKISNDGIEKFVKTRGESLRILDEKLVVAAS